MLVIRRMPREQPLIESNNKTGQSLRAPIIPVSAPISSSPSAPSTTLSWPIFFTPSKYPRKSLTGRQCLGALCVDAIFLPLRYTYTTEKLTTNPQTVPRFAVPCASIPPLKIRVGGASPHLFSLRTSFRALFITPTEPKKSVVYGETRQI